MTVADEKENLVYSVECRDLPCGLYRLFTQGERRLLLGAAESDGKILRLNRRFSKTLISGVGTASRGEIVRVGGEVWQPLPQGQNWFPDHPEGALFRREGDGVCLALPYAAEKPFALTRYFCFARMAQIGSENYALFHLDSARYPKI